MKKEKEIEQKEIPIETPVVTENKISESRERPSLVLVSEIDAYVSDRMKSQPKTLDEVLFIKEKKYEPGEHRLSLPKEFLKYEKRFAFRWINKKKRAIDDAVDMKGWVLVNRALFPDVPQHLFTTSGGVERGDAILGFMAKAKAEAIRRRPGEISRERIKTHPMIREKLEPLDKGQSGFYKPENTSAESEKDGVEGTITTGLQEDRDF